MKTKQIEIKSLLLALLSTFAIFSSCSKNPDINGNSNNKDIVSVSVSNSNPSPYEIVGLKIKGKLLSLENYKGKIGNDSITAVKQGTDSLVIMIPYLTANTYQVTLDIEGAKANFNLKIKEQAPIVNQVQVLDAFVASTNNSVTNLETSLASTGQTLSAGDKELVTNLVSSFNGVYNQLTPEQKIQFAQYVSTHPELSGLNGLKVKANMTDDILQKYKISIVKRMLPIGVASHAFYITLYSPDPLGKIICLGSVVIIVKLVIEVNENAHKLYQEAVIPYEFTNDLPDGALQSPIFKMISLTKNYDFTFTNNRPSDLNVTLKMRTIYSKDQSTNIPALSEITTSLEQFQTIWNKLDGAIATLKSLFGFSGGGLSNKAPSLSLVTTYQIKKIEGLTQNVSIVNISNPNVKVVVDKSGSKPKVTFSTTQSGDQDFNFTYRYTDGVTLDKIYSAVLKGAEPFSISLVSGNNQIGELGKALANPIKVRVKDEAGKPYAGAKVNFTANNGGTVSQTQATTGTDGTASVNWTLGSSDIKQSLVVRGLKSDNITSFNGLYLYANSNLINTSWVIYYIAGSDHITGSVTFKDDGTSYYVEQGFNPVYGTWSLNENLLHWNVFGNQIGTWVFNGTILGNTMSGVWVNGNNSPWSAVKLN